ncbi:PAS domain S-box protein [Pseudidiomarina sp. E22-M8]|uniref:PAS domain S-box protein n=1 Tax=Pseudidiomarina sp. E22-M8 TaxID=3424768 RepID=UPI00403CB4C2
MTVLNIPMNEAERLVALRALHILDTPAERRFDRLTRLAAHIMDAPIALISLVDENRLWFKAHFGMDVCEAPRKFSFCSHALDSYSPFIVTDVAQDPRFTNNIYVKGAPGVRFYAGIPLRGPGDHIVGTLCVLDIKPREITTSDIEALQNLAEIVEAEMGHLELESVSTQLQRSNQKLAAVILASPLAIITCDRQQRIDVWNSSAETLIGVKASNAVGEQLAVINEAMSDKLFEMSQQMPKDGIVRGELFDIRLADGYQRHLELSVAPLKGVDGQQNGFTLVIVDITEREQLLQKSEYEHQLLEALLNNIDAGVAACDESGILTFFNRAAREYLGEPISSGAEEWAQHYKVYDATGEHLLTAEELPLYRA